MTLQEQPRSEEVLDLNQGFWPLTAGFSQVWQEWTFKRANLHRGQRSAYGTAADSQSKADFTHERLAKLPNDDLIHVAEKLLQV